MHLSKKAISAVCLSLSVILALSGTACKKRVSDNGDAQAEARAEKQVRNSIDDLFAYIKMSRFDKIGALCSGSASDVDRILEIKEGPEGEALEAAGSRVKGEITSVTISLDPLFARAEVKITQVDFHEVAILAYTGHNGFSDAKELKSAVESAESEEITVTLSLVYQEKWVLTESSMHTLMETLYGSFLEEKLLAEPTESSTEAPQITISVFDSYWVDRKGNETKGYHCSDTKICLYCYTWNTYNNLEVRYQYEDISGQILYENTYTVRNNSDWICCSWPVSSPLPEGPIRINLYGPSDVLFHTAETTIYPDDQMIPFPMDIYTCGWLDAEQMEVGYYYADTEYICYMITTLKYYEGLKLKYQFLDEEGEVLFEGTITANDMTDTFYFVWDEDIEIPEDLKMLHLVVTTSIGEPFCEADIPIETPLVEESELLPQDADKT